jgi:hypothetical protein
MLGALSNRLTAEEVANPPDAAKELVHGVPRL